MRSTVAQLPDVTGGALPVASVEVVPVEDDRRELLRMCDEVRRLSRSESCEIIRVAAGCLPLDDFQKLSKEIENEIKARCAEKEGAE